MSYTINDIRTEVNKIISEVKDHVEKGWQFCFSLVHFPHASIINKKSTEDDFNNLIDAIVKDIQDDEASFEETIKNLRDKTKALEERLHWVSITVNVITPIEAKFNIFKNYLIKTFRNIQRP